MTYLQARAVPRTRVLHNPLKRPPVLREHGRVGSVMVRLPPRPTGLERGKVQAIDPTDKLTHPRGRAHQRDRIGSRCD